MTITKDKLQELAVEITKKLDGFKQGYMSCLGDIQQVIDTPEPVKAETSVETPK